MSFYGDATSVAVDSEDHVYVFNRGLQPVMIFDSDGRYLGGWGEGEFGTTDPGPRATTAGPHGVFIDDDDSMLLVDVVCHLVQKRTLDGKVLTTIGVRGKASKAGSGEPFNRPTDAVVHPRTGDIFVSDGYGNCSVHRYDAEGRHIISWGQPGSAPGEFNTPHGLVVLGDDRVFVCDRENYRIQVFTTDGTYVDQWNCHHPQAIRYWNGLLFVGELDSHHNPNNFPNLGHAVSIWDTEGNFISRFGAPYPGEAPDQFISGPHGLALDSHGDFYGADVACSWLMSRKVPRPLLGEVISLRKWRRL
jgi:hypothetical protein